MQTIVYTELDEHYARLCSLTRKQLRYILDPHGLSQEELEDILDPWEYPTYSGLHLLPAVPAEEFPGETFRVLKEKEIRKYGEYRTRRLVLEAWDKLEGIEPAPVSAPAPVVHSKPDSSEPSAAKPPEPVAMKVKEYNPAPENPAQPMLSDFGLYKCQGRRKMVMGFEKEKHVREVHGGVEVEWKRVNCKYSGVFS